MKHCIGYFLFATTENLSSPFKHFILIFILTEVLSCTVNSVS